VVEHANTPRFQGEWLDPIAHYGLGAVFLDGRLRIDASYSTGVSLKAEGDGGWPGEIRGGIAGAPIEGLDIFADTRVRDDVGRFGGGVELGFGMFAARAGVYGQYRDDTVGFDGVTASLTLRSESVESLISPSQRWIRL